MDTLDVENWALKNALGASSISPRVMTCSNQMALKSGEGGTRRKQGPATVVESEK